MTLRDNPRWQQRQDVLNALDANRKRRRKAEAALDDARDELTELLIRGKSLPWPLKIAEMARTADVSRETAHKLLRREQS